MEFCDVWLNITPFSPFLHQTFKDSLPKCHINTSVEILDTDDNEAMSMEHFVTVFVLTNVFVVIISVNLNTYLLFA